MSDKNREELKKKATAYHEEAHAVVCRHYGACIGFPRTRGGRYGLETGCHTPGEDLDPGPDGVAGARGLPRVDLLPGWDRC